MKPTITRRLEQIKEYNLPHIISGGNELGSKLEEVGIFEGNIPEVIISHSPRDIKEFPQCASREESKELAITLSNATGGLLSPEDFNGSIGNFNMYMNATEVHAFYDPSSDTTHYFILPSQKFIDERLK